MAQTVGQVLAGANVAAPPRLYPATMGATSNPPVVTLDGSADDTEVVIVGTTPAGGSRVLVAVCPFGAFVLGTIGG